MTPTLTRRLYSISWLLLGAIAIGYFYTLFQSLDGPRTALLQATPPASGSNGEAAQAAPATDPSLTRALTHMRGEIDRLKSSLDSASRENEALKAHINTLEKTFGPSTASLPPEPEKPEPVNLEKLVKDKKEDGARSAPVPKVEVTSLPMPGDGFADELPQAPLPIAGQREPQRTLFAVELASGLKADALKARWGELKQRHAKMLDLLQPRVVKARTGSSEDDQRYNLVAGPFENAAAAARLCARLSAAGARCEGAVFTGSLLDTIAAR